LYALIPLVPPLSPPWKKGEDLLTELYLSQRSGILLRTAPSLFSREGWGGYKIRYYFFLSFLKTLTKRHWLLGLLNVNTSWDCNSKIRIPQSEINNYFFSTLSTGNISPTLSKCAYCLYVTRPSSDLGSRAKIIRFPFN
jgi:hypothetical protein